MLLRGLMFRKRGGFFISLDGVDGGGGAGVDGAMVFDRIVICRCGGGVEPMLHGLIVRRRRLIICKGRSGNFGGVWTLTEGATRLQLGGGC
jgi:hypothetical protein